MRKAVCGIWIGAGIDFVRCNLPVQKFTQGNDSFLGYPARIDPLSDSLAANAEMLADTGTRCSFGDFFLGLFVHVLSFSDESSIHDESLCFNKTKDIVLVLSETLGCKMNV